MAKIMRQWRHGATFFNHENIGSRKEIPDIERRFFATGGNKASP
jgi:hypothetical protein